MENQNIHNSNTNLNNDENLRAAASYFGWFILYPMLSSRPKTVFVKQHLEYGFTLMLAQSAVSFMWSYTMPLFAPFLMRGSIISLVIMIITLLIFSAISIGIWGLGVYNLIRAAMGYSRHEIVIKAIRMYYD